MRPMRGLLCAALAALPTVAAAQTVHSPPITAGTDEKLVRPAGYVQVWADEFDRPGLPDPKKWAYDTGRNKEGWYNDEKQYYAADRPENARIENGRLILTARKERLSDRPDFGGQDYASGKLVTRGLADWTYGYVEVRAKLACGRGIWPAIWMLASDGKSGWPAMGEIDIMEHVGWDQGRVHGTVHSKAYNHVAKTQKGANVMVPDACTAFHDYQLDWNEDRILIGIDGDAFMRFDNDHKGDPATWPFASPQYLILNVAVGGWGGQKGIDPAAFPASMEVDYVRIWQKR
ncbi:beta-glucanase (GH16 family) [Sphingomonas naasensis]|uniref:Glycoside hydrolase family 16 protein n=1 Tax=Sphingomonas naasensis TaxID=1344951 RepID=A0A4S1WDV3_9SPHN|nr:glycoside hydrolase family 16 protein [Sphingomonas naasensis]NIJ22252.1 beta-glucanase (GH16 family) [Sphingomonas naasensis]TGX40733.1 glycoside hydrolase family 16 protein [Sphingomonas naasensis]